MSIFSFLLTCIFKSKISTGKKKQGRKDAHNEKHVRSAKSIGKRGINAHKPGHSSNYKPEDLQNPV